MISGETTRTIAAQLFDGGLRPEDREWLKSYYELTDEETDENIRMLEDEDGL